MSSTTEATPSNAVQPYVAPTDESVAEFTWKAIVLGSIFGVLFGASTVYLALKAGLTVSASIPIAVLAISIGKRFLKTTILENNIIQTCGSAGESVAAGVVFTLPAFIFLSDGIGTSYFHVFTIMMIATFGGILGTLMMIPLRRPLIVAEHDTLPYPEGTACAQVLIAGEKGGSLASMAFIGLGFAVVYAILQKVLHFIVEVPRYVTAYTNKYLPSAAVEGEITPEYLGVGYIIGPKIGGILVAGSVLAAFALTPLLSTLVPPKRSRLSWSKSVTSQRSMVGRKRHSASTIQPVPSTAHTFARLALVPWPPPVSLRCSRHCPRSSLLFWKPSAR